MSDPSLNLSDIEGLDEVYGAYKLTRNTIAIVIVFLIGLIILQMMEAVSDGTVWLSLVGITIFYFAALAYLLTIKLPKAAAKGTKAIATGPAAVWSAVKWN